MRENSKDTLQTSVGWETGNVRGPCVKRCTFSNWIWERRQGVRHYLVASGLERVKITWKKQNCNGNPGSESQTKLNKRSHHHNVTQEQHGMAWTFDNPPILSQFVISEWTATSQSRNVLFLHTHKQKPSEINANSIWIEFHWQALRYNRTVI